MRGRTRRARCWASRSRCWLRGRCPTPALPLPLPLPPKPSTCPGCFGAVRRFVDRRLFGGGPLTWPAAGLGTAPTTASAAHPARSSRLGQDMSQRAPELNSVSLQGEQCRESPCGLNRIRADKSMPAAGAASAGGGRAVGARRRPVARAPLCVRRAGPRRAAVLGGVCGVAYQARAARLPRAGRRRPATLSCRAASTPSTQMCRQLRPGGHAACAG